MTNNFSFDETAGRQAKWLFASLLTLSFVGLQPFTYENWLADATAGTGEGDVWRQASYAGIFLLIAWSALYARSARTLFSLPRSLGLLLAWCVFSVLWSVAPEITLRRAALTVMVAASVFWSINLIGVEAVLRIIRAVLVCILCVNLIAILLLPEAVHLHDDSDLSLIGAWRGLHPHKNSAAPISAISALLFFHDATRSGRLRHWLLFFGAIVFTVGTQSKTSLGVFCFALLIGYAYNRSQASSASRRRFRYILLGMVAILALMMTVALDHILMILSDEQVFTGRGMIWHLLLAYVNERPLLGAGFGAFWNSGDASPVLRLAADELVLRYKQSHNGYLQILVETGAIGLVLALIALVLMPMRQMLFSNLSRESRASLWFSWVVFCLGLNFMEAQLVSRDAPSWVVLLIALACLGYQRNVSRAIRGAHRIGIGVRNAPSKSERHEF